VVIEGRASQKPRPLGEELLSVSKQEILLVPPGSSQTGVFTAARVARNNRDWHRLIETCSLLDARSIGHEAIHPLWRSGDRFLLALIEGGRTPKEGEK